MLKCAYFEDVVVAGSLVAEQFAQVELLALDSRGGEEHADEY